MTTKAARIARTWLASIAFVAAIGSIVLALALNAQQNAETARTVHRSAISRCHDAREGKGRTLGLVQILVDLDRAADGRVSATTLEFQRRVREQYVTLRSCEQLGLSSNAIYPTTTTTNGRIP